MLRPVVILDCNDVGCPGVLLFVFLELAGAFQRRGHDVRVVKTIADIPHSAIVFMGDIFRCANPVQLLCDQAPKALFFGWYWHNIEQTSRFKYFVCLHENMLAPEVDARWPKLLAVPRCPLLLRANEAADNIGKLPRHPVRDYCYMGWGYCAELVPGHPFTGIYHGVYDWSKFMSYDDRRQLYLSSHFALGFQSPENIERRHVSQRIFEGLAYGCVVLSNSIAAVEQTNGIVQLISSKVDLEAQMNHLLKSPFELLALQERGYEFARQFGTNEFAASKLQACFFDVWSNEF